MERFYDQEAKKIEDGLTVLMFIIYFLKKRIVNP